MVTYVLIFGLIIWIGADILPEIYETQRGFSPSSDKTVIATARTYTDAEIQDAIAKSDYYERHRDAFTKAATFLLTERHCGRHELREYGGFVKAQGGYKEQPVYFTYCGGMTVSNRIYVDVSTGKIFK
jgi:hypothetical protein